MSDPEVSTARPMPRRIDTRNAILGAALVALSLVLSGAQSCSGGTEHVPFRAEGLKSGGEPIFRNEPIVIRFSRPLAVGAPAADAVALRDAAGAAVPFRLESRGSFLALLPVRDAGWPEVGKLVVELVWPPLTQSIRSARGEPLEEGFEARVRVMAAHRPGEGELQLLDIVTQRALVPGGVRGLPPSQEQKLVFNAAIDPASLAKGIRLVNLRTGKEVPHDHYYTRLSDTDGCVVYVGQIMPRADDPSVHVFEGGGRYRLLFTHALRSYDGRCPLRDRAFWHFDTPDHPFGFIQVDFDEESDFDADSRHFFKPGEPLRPGRKPPSLGVSIQPRRAGAEDEPVALFKDEPSATFVRIPARYLPGQGEQKLFIQAIAIRTDVPSGLRMDIERFEASLAYLVAGRNLERDPAGTEKLLRELQRGFETYTWEQHEDTRILKIPLVADPPPGSDERQGRPFYYDGEGKDLVLKLSNEGLSSPRGDREMRVPVFKPEIVDQYDMLLSLDGRTELLKVLPSMVLITYSYSPVDTRWYELKGFPHPEFSRTPNLDFQGKGLELQDFEVLYQGGRINDDGEVIPQGDWSPYPPRDGSNAVRLRITLTPNPNAPMPGEDEPEIDHLILHFIWGRDE